MKHAFHVGLQQMFAMQNGKDSELFHEICNGPKSRFFLLPTNLHFRDFIIYLKHIGSQ